MLFSIVFLVACGLAKVQRLSASKMPASAKTLADTLRFLYLQPSETWPAPHVDSGILWQELDIIPNSPLNPAADSVTAKYQLGKMLFFDPRLSGSGQISCATCHVPNLNWTDAREKSSGHNQILGKRNSPTLLNTWYATHFFWDGRSKSLEDQAFGPINSEKEMNNSMGNVVRTLRDIAEYRPFFDSAFAERGINPQTITEAIAVFEKTLVSQKARFDHYLQGDTNAMSDAALRGLHLFRTKARCMNCHYGPLLTDNGFHNIGLTYYKTEHEDLGRYMLTRKPEDVGRFKTPSLRDVMRTRPWMHNGLFDDMEEIIKLFNEGMHQPAANPDAEIDPLFPKTDPLLKKLHLNKQEQLDLIAFLESVTAAPLKFKTPVLPGF